MLSDYNFDDETEQIGVGVKQKKISKQAQKDARQLFKDQQNKLKSDQERLALAMSQLDQERQAFRAQSSMPSQMQQQIQGGIDVNYEIVQNKLAAIRSALVDNKQYFPDKKDKYVTDMYGIRRQTEAFRIAQQEKRDSKARGYTQFDLVDGLLQFAPQARDAAGTSGLLSRFVGLKVNEKGSIMINGKVVGWKNYTRKMLNLDEFEMRSPVTLYIKRLAQLERAKAQLKSYIEKGKTLEQARLRKNDPVRIQAQKYARLKGIFKNYENDPQRVEQGYDYKVRLRLQQQQQKRQDLLNRNDSEYINAQAEAYQRALEVQNAMKQFHAARKQQV